MKKLFIVVNVDWFFLSHRKEVALAAQKYGWDITIITVDTGKLKDIQDLGLKTVNLPMNRSGMNMFQELNTLLFLYRLYVREKPDVVHHVGVKTILWGTIAAKFSKVGGIVNAISGLGMFFSDDNNSLLAKLMPIALRFSHNRNNLLVIFQNDEDKNLYIKNKIIKECQSRYIKGSGVDLNDYFYTSETTSGKIKVIITARMIVEKGIFILIDAAEKLRGRYENILEFLLVGGIDDHPGAITKEQIESKCDGVYIKWLGYRSDVKELLMQSHIVAFPSYYMEGLPKSLIEACAIGRPIITCNSVGCKETVIDGYNGYLIPIKDASTLASKLATLIDNKELRMEMGKNSRKYAENNFSLDLVIEKHLAIYQELLENK